MKPAALSLSTLFCLLAFAQPNPLCIQFTPNVVKGAQYKPDSGPTPHVGILILHDTSNFLSHMGAKQLLATMA